LGSIEDTSSYKYSIVIDTRYQKPSQILDTAIETVDGHTVRVKDVAGLAYVSTNDSSHVTIDGKPAVALDIANTSDSNSIQVVKAVKKALPSIQALLPGGVTLQTYSDNTAFVASTINSVGINAIEGILLAALIIFIFLRNRKAAFIISLSMPISIFGTIGLMNMMGYTMNVVSMSGLILGIGMIVDASIVILENIYKKEEAGMEPLAASIEGSHEMTSAVFASMLTSVCVFFPMYMYHNQLGIIGVMVEGFLFAIMSCLILSFIVATTLVPALAGPILKMKTHRQQPLKNRFLAYVDQKMSNFESKVTTFYGRSINYALDHRLLLISLFVALLLFFVSFVPHMNKSLLTPVKTSDSMIASLTYADGTSQHVVEKELDRVEKELSAKLDSAAYTSIRCTAEDNEGTLTISLPPADEQPLDFQQLSDAVRPVLEGNPLAKWTISQAAASMASSAVDVEIFSTDSKSAKVASDRLMDALKRKVPDVTNLKSDAVAGAPRLRIVPDQKRLDALGITASQIEATLYTAIGGAKAATITSFDSNDSRDLVVTLAPRFVDDISALGSLMIDTSVGKVRLDSIAAIEDSVGPTIIYREDKRRINHITADAVDGVSTSQVNAEVQEVVKAVVLPEGVNLSLAGQMSDFADADATFRTVLLLALALVFTVMASQFESIKDPFIIFVSIPLLLIGVIAIHLIMGMDITMFSLIGIIALVGIVVNNGIVLVDAINGLVARKIPVKQACRMAAESRLRPILMTTLTTILGMIPLGFFPGAGSELMQPVAVTIIGGIISGAFLTLFLTPIVYSIVQKNKLEKMFNDKDSNANQLIRYDVLKKEKERA
jgi:multidrug efflux pump subunit AcrB